MSMCFIHGLGGIAGGSGNAEPPAEYKPYVETAKTLYTGEYDGYYIAENFEYLTVAFVMPDFHITNYVPSSTEFEAYGWYSCRYHKPTNTWDTFDFRQSASTGWNYTHNIIYVSPLVFESTLDGSVDSVLNNNTWEIIHAHSSDGNNYWSIGDRKAVTLNGTIGTLDVNETYYVYILGFNHNSINEGVGIHFSGFKTTLTDGIDICLVDSKYDSTSTDGTKYFNMNHSSYINNGGWKGCDLRYDILGSVHSKDAQEAISTTATSPVSNTLMAALPSDLRTVMQPMTKYSDNTGGGGDTASYVTATIDYLPLLGEYEIFGTRKHANSAEQNYQKQYTYFVNGNSKVKCKHNNITTPSRWWGRSVKVSNNSCFSSVYSGGEIDFAQANTSYGISPIFKV